MSPLYASKRKFRSNRRLSTFLSWLNRQSVAGLTCARKFRNSIHTRMRLYRNTSRDLSTRLGKILKDPCPASPSAKYPIWHLTEHSSGFVHWHGKTDRYLGPLEDRGEEKNVLIELLPLALGSPQMPSAIMYDAIEF